MNNIINKIAASAVLMLGFAPLAAQELTPTQTHPEEGWNGVTIPATYYEDLMTNNVDIRPGHCWTVRVEQNQTNPGWYRFQPYTSMNDYVPKMMEETDDTYIYVNATDPSRVWVETFTPYADWDDYMFVNMVPENGWTQGEGKYGTFSDDVIQFEPYSFSVYDGGYDIWYEVSRTTGFKLVLNETEAKDYVVSVTASACTSFPQISYKADGGHDIWDLKALVIPGEFKPEYYQKALEEGEIIDFQWRQYKEVEDRGLYTVVVVGVDRQGNMVGCDHDFGYNVIDNDDDWMVYGWTEYTDILVSGRHEEVARATYAINIQKHRSIPGYFRLEDPYYYHPSIAYPQYKSDHSHSHYIYINASDADHPYIESSPIGVDYGNGDISIASAAGRLVAQGLSNEEIKGKGVKFGKVEEGGCLSFPAGSLLINEKKLDKDEWYPLAEGFRVQLPGLEPTAVDSVMEAGTEETRVYNMQGVELKEIDSVAPGIYIVNGKKVVVK